MLSKLYVLLWVMCLAVTAHAADETVSLATVNLAGEQRMLSQRLAKAYVQAGLNVVPVVANEQIRESITRFEGNLERLQSGIAGAGGEALSAYRGLAEEWAALRAAAKLPATRDAALAVSQNSVAVLERAEQLTQLVALAAAGEAGMQVNLAGRQRMLSQRVVKAYMLYSWGAGAPEVQHEMESAAREFGAALAVLSALPDNTDSMRVELEEIALQWEWLQTALAGEGAMSYRLVVAEAADSILLATDRLTRMYEQAGGR